MAAALEVIVGPIEALAVDVVVNAANRDLKPGSGVDAALRAAAGSGLTQHTDTLPPIEDGQAVLTPGFNLPARAIIHTAAPRWNTPGEEGAKVAALARCYMASIALANEHGFSAIAFPCLGTGAYGWPRGFACAIAIAACEQALEKAPNIARIVFCCASEADAELYRAGLAGD
ncbi:MAG: macro domain-containing protein [Hyphomonadaceae bacterium]|nr:macro domain-containing protein [Hyphomonadaceae bacterium]